MRTGIGYRVGTGLLETSTGFIGGEAGRDWDILNWTLCGHLFPGERLGVGSMFHSFIFRSRSALPMTETELMLIAAPAIIGLSSKPKNG